MEHRSAIANALALIFEGIRRLKGRFPEKSFTIDGRLVGDIGEVLAALEYDVTLYERQTPTHDGSTSNGRQVQVKATFKKSLTMTSIPEVYLGFKLYADGEHEEVFNGPGSVIAEAFSHRAGIGEKRLSFPIAALKALSSQVSAEQKVARRAL